MSADQVDFSRFFEQSRVSCRRTVVAAVGDRDLAEDLVAEAYARAWASWARVSRHPAPEAWIVRTCLNANVSWWRRRRRETNWDDSGLDRQVAAGLATGSGLVAEVPDVDLVGDRRIWAALKALPERQRHVLALRVFLDLDTQTTARTLGIAQGTVRAHLHRASEALRRELAYLEQEELR